jgi:hypothetical protein
MSKAKEGKYYSLDGFEITVIKDSFGYFIASISHPDGRVGPRFYLEDEDDDWITTWVHEDQKKAMDQFDNDLEDLLKDD